MTALAERTTAVGEHTVRINKSLGVEVDKCESQ
jgi:hypothetical protein